MNQLIISFVLLLFISYGTDKKQSIKTTMIAKVEVPKTKTTTITNNTVTIIDNLYTLQFKIEKTKNDKHNLIIEIHPKKGSFFISPLETKESKGKFYMDLGSYKDISFDGNIIETPLSITTLNHSSKAPMLWIKEKTIYTQPLNILSEEDFEVFGRVQFTIEPRCTFEEIPFAISYKDGKMIFIDPKC